MASSNIVLNGVTVSPSAITRTYTKVGTTVVAANGSRTFTQRGLKSTWEIRADDVTLAEMLKYAGIVALTSTFTFTDEDGNNFTVQCEDAACTVDVSQYGPTRVYTVKLTIYEA